MLVSAPSFSTSPSPLDPHLASVPPRPPRTLLEPARHPGTAAFALFRGTRTRRTRAHSEQMSRGRTMAPRSATTHLDASTSRPLPQAGSVTARACFTELQPLVARHTASSGDCPPPPAPRRRPTDASPASSPSAKPRPGSSRVAEHQRSNGEHVRAAEQSLTRTSPSPPLPLPPPDLQEARLEEADLLKKVRLSSPCLVYRAAAVCCASEIGVSSSTDSAPPPATGP